jgi:hypothetical protein
MANLKPMKQPEVVDDKVDISFKERIYNATQDPERIPSQPQGDKRVASDRFVWKVPLDSWQQLLLSVRGGQTESIIESCEKLESSRRSPAACCVLDVSSEVPNIAHARQMCRFILSLGRASVMKIQMSATMDRGLLSPCIQLMTLTQSLDICLEHRHDPVLCYVNVINDEVVKKKYNSLEQYRDGWLHQVAIEGAHQSVMGEKSITIHNVEIKWNPQSNDQISGVICLRKSFCDDRYIELSGIRHYDEDEEDDDDAAYYDEDNNGLPLDYFCIRYSNLTPNDTADDTTRYAIDFNRAITWIGHCLSHSVTTVTTSDEKVYEIKVKLFKNMTACPVDLTTLGKDQTATIEFMPKILPIKLV